MDDTWKVRGVTTHELIAELRAYCGIGPGRILTGTALVMDRAAAELERLQVLDNERVTEALEAAYEIERLRRIEQAARSLSEVYSEKWSGGHWDKLRVALAASREWE